MSVVCEACGKSNRANAMFCIGCAGRLPGFVASGPAALASRPQPLASDSAMPVNPPVSSAPTHVRSRPVELEVAPTAFDALAFRPPSHRPTGRARGTLAKGDAGSMLSAEARKFWMLAGGLILVTFVAFMAWYLYVTRPVGVAAQPGSMAVAPAAEGSGAAAPASASDVAPAAPSEPVQAAVEDAPAKKSASPVATSAVPPAASVAPDADAAPTATAPARVAEQRAPTARPPRAAAAPQTPRAPRYARADPVGEPSAEAVARSLAMARAESDSGPPIVAGPGPRNANNEPVRAPPRARVLPSDDLGPPIAVGPGPQVDYSTPRAGGR